MPGPGPDTYRRVHPCSWALLVKQKKTLTSRVENRLPSKTFQCPHVEDASCLWHSKLSVPLGTGTAWLAWSPAWSQARAAKGEADTCPSQHL